MLKNFFLIHSEISQMLVLINIKAFNCPAGKQYSPGGNGHCNVWVDEIRAGRNEKRIVGFP